MAKFVLRDAFVSVNSIDLSDHASAVEISTSRPEVSTTSMGDDFQSFVGGIPDATITVTYFQDFAAGEVDATHWGLVNSDAPFPVAIRPTSAAISATNPEFQMTSLLLGDYKPLAGGVGDASTTAVTYRNASQTGLVRDTTP